MAGARMTDGMGTAPSYPRERFRRLAGLPFHPLLFFLFPVVSLLGWNIQELYPDQALRSLAVSLLACLALWGGFTLITRDRWRAALLTSLTGLMFFTYGHVYEMLDGLRTLGLPLARHRFLLPAWAAVFLAVVVVLTRRRTSPRAITPVLNLVGLVALFFPLLSLVTFYFRTVPGGDPDGRRMPTVHLQAPADGEMPDIYYVILDGYARSDYMREVYGFDNAEFIDYLESQGFYVASQSHSNHNWTALSIASSLNLTLAQHLGANLRPGFYPTPFIDLIRTNLVSRSLRKIGYHTIGLQSGYLPTEWVEADRYLGPAAEDIASEAGPFVPNAFEGLLLEATVLQPLLHQQILDLDYGDTPIRHQSYPFELLRAIILSAFDHLSRPLPLDPPRLVFAHIVAPHRPYLFTASGEAIQSDEPFTLMEVADESGNSGDLYRGQAEFITGRARQAVESILSRSEVPPVIILQADHGAGVGTDEAERTAIFNAILIRQDCRPMLYPEITPVNTFRVVLNCYFDAGLPLLADDIYWSKWPRQSAYEFLLLNPEPELP